MTHLFGFCFCGNCAFKDIIIQNGSMLRYHKSHGGIRKEGINDQKKQASYVKKIYLVAFILNFRFIFCYMQNFNVYIDLV